MWMLRGEMRHEIWLWSQDIVFWVGKVARVVKLSSLRLKGSGTIPAYFQGLWMGSKGVSNVFQYVELRVSRADIPGLARILRTSKVYG